jgi:hypothetical protein
MYWTFCTSVRCCVELAEAAVPAVNATAIKTQATTFLTSALLLKDLKEDCNLPNRFAHCGYAASCIDFVEHLPLTRTEFFPWLLHLYPDEPTCKTHKQVGDTDFLKAVVITMDLEAPSFSIRDQSLDPGYELTLRLSRH